jgi:LacI family transcriptional regulator
MSDAEGFNRDGKPTAKAVAKRAGVSVTTVSRVLNGRTDDISDATRDRVLEAARALRYRPSSLAAALRRGYTRTVGLVVPDISDAYFHQIARGVDDVAQEHGYTVILCNTDREAAKEHAAIEALYDQNVDAMIFGGGGVDDDAHLRDLPLDLMNVVTVGPHRLSFPSIGVDDTGAIHTAMDHLLGQGRRRVLCVGGRDNWLIRGERIEGYRQALREHGLAYDPALVFSGDFSITAGYDAVRHAIDAGTHFDAVMAFNDYTAVGAMQALHEFGRRIPEDVAVVGCDDIPLAALVRPTLSSVSFPQREFGAAAMRTVLDLRAGRPVQPVTQFDYFLHVRDSSAPSGWAASTPAAPGADEKEEKCSNPK